jgi:hypothetical protein
LSIASRIALILLMAFLAETQLSEDFLQLKFSREPGCPRSAAQGVAAGRI